MSSSTSEPLSPLVKEADAAESPPPPPSESITEVVEVVELTPPAEELKPDESAKEIIYEETAPVKIVQKAFVEKVDPPAEPVHEVITEETTQPAEPVEYVFVRADTVRPVDYVFARPDTVQTMPLSVEEVHEVAALTTTPPLEEVYQIPLRANTTVEPVFLVAQRDSLRGSIPLPPVYYVPTRANTTGDLPDHISRQMTSEVPEALLLESKEISAPSVEKSPRQRLIKALSRRHKTTRKNLKKLDKQNAEVDNGDIRAIKRRAKFGRLLLRLRKLLRLLRGRTRRQPKIKADPATGPV
jgi:hypothetical protein